MKYLFFSIAILCLIPPIPGSVALALGLFFSFFLGNPCLDYTKRMTPQFLQLSIVGLGAGMNLLVVGKAGLEGVGYTALGIIFTFLLGLGLGKALKIEAETSLLITAGTAICGGSAIAAVASAIGAKPKGVSVSLVIVFVLNAIALFIFPGIGRTLGLVEGQFGLWSALAIHDTSSVVGAALQYGSQAVEVATTVKLARALWIIPLSLILANLWRRSDSAQKPKRPWFILGFLCTAALVTWVPSLRGPGEWVNWGAKRTLVATLFFIGSSLNRDTLKSVGFRPFVQGVSLWIAVASATLGAIMIGWIHI